MGYQNILAQMPGLWQHARIQTRSAQNFFAFVLVMIVEAAAFIYGS